ncbi:MAG TPA: cob(I)yrinic acid a,c-diamide adenosyltransferase [Bdellovibrionota bacterium]|nr:cob(I)yrinic acid a,c-diamide adenosyltransferase [Bdellovibrionota bacterium]
MKIYTKRGDAGQTDLLAGTRVAKDHPRIEVYGTVDELNSILGLVLSEPALPVETRRRLTPIQSELFQLGTELATPAGKPLMVEPVSEAMITRLEGEIDTMEADLQPLKNFILPGGRREAGLLHVARTVCRRAERGLVSMAKAEGIEAPANVLRYLNRLSDYLFVSGRWVNHKLGEADVPWHAPRTR